MQNETQNEKVARLRIERRKRFGVKKNITKYQELIFNTFYDETILKEKLGKFLETTGKENLNDAFLQYLKDVSQKTKELLQQAKELLIDSWEKGTKRIQDQDGNTIRFDEVVDENAIELLVRQQEKHYQSLNKQQTRAVDRIIANGLKKGESVEKIVENIQSRIKSLTRYSATRIARTEIVHTHNVGQVQTMQKAGIEKYSYINSPDYIGKDGKKYPCIICRKLQGAKGREHIYDVDKAGSSEKHPLPVLQSHPNCNCVCVARIDKQ